ncbi:MAG: nucleotidyltransferase family protein [bacterium]
MTEKEILEIIENDENMMKIIKVASSLNLPDWMIGAGFIRNKIWDYLSGNKEDGFKTADIDLSYYDAKGNDEEADKMLSEKMEKETGIEWEIVNEFYANKWNNLPKYKSTEDAISQWPETVTALGITLDKDNTLHLIAPYGISDLINFIVRPTPVFENKKDVIIARIEKKKWKERWPKIHIIF